MHQCIACPQGSTDSQWVGSSPQTQSTCNRCMCFMSVKLVSAVQTHFICQVMHFLTLLLHNTTQSLCNPISDCSVAVVHVMLPYIESMSVSATKVPASTCQPIYCCSWRHSHSQQLYVTIVCGPCRFGLHDAHCGCTCTTSVSSVVLCNRVAQRS